MRRTHVKICGNVSEAEVLSAAVAGADAVGVISGITQHASSAVDVLAARQLLATAPLFVARVLVSQLADEDLLALTDMAQPDIIQAHGDLSPQQRERLYRARGHRRVIGVVGVTGSEVLHTFREIEMFSDALLLDSRSADKLGGTGATHDWEVSARIAKASSVPVILAGGLTPDNVAEAVRQVRPWGVDANSGVRRDGRLDRERVAAFVDNAQV